MPHENWKPYSSHPSLYKRLSYSQIMQFVLLGPNTRFCMSNPEANAYAPKPS